MAGAQALLQLRKSAECNICGGWSKVPKGLDQRLASHTHTHTHTDMCPCIRMYMYVVYMFTARDILGVRM